MGGKSQNRIHPSGQRKNTPLLFLMLTVFPLYGGYYNFSVLLVGAVLSALLAIQGAKTGTIGLTRGVEGALLGGYCLLSFATIPVAVSGGMALTGALRACTWLLFFIYAASYSTEERREILDVLAYEGALLSAVSTIAFFFDAGVGISDANGRIDGLFQYANAWGLYQLVCLLLLALKKERKVLDYPAAAVLLLGIFLTGSRGVFLLLIICALWFAIYGLLRRKKMFPILGGAAAIICLLLTADALSGGLTSTRLRAISTTSSSLNGRILYIIDGVRMVLKHPLGLGRGGYLYQQCLEQTGIYTLRFVHNEYLQAALDAGVAGGILFSAFIVLLLLKKRGSVRERVVLFVIAAHAMIDFDFQFASLMFLLLLCGEKDEVCPIYVGKRLVPVACLCVSAVFLSFSLIYYFDFTGRYDAAYKMWNADLELVERRLQNSSSLEEGELYANQIVKMSDLSMIAWDCKYQLAAKHNNIPEMVRTKYQYLRLNRYQGDAYEEMTELLEKACIHCSEEERLVYESMANTLVAQLEEVKEHTSILAYRIADKPDLEFSTEIIKRLNAITKKG